MAGLASQEASGLNHLCKLRGNGPVTTVFAVFKVPLNALLRVALGSILCFSCQALLSFGNFKSVVPSTANGIGHASPVKPAEQHFARDGKV
jgi:hypothetical protein